MNEPIKYNEDPKHAEALLKFQEMKLEAGVIGGFLGSQQRTASSIAWIMILILVCTGIFTLFGSCTISFTEYWKTIGPFITLALGYLFGRRGE